MCLSTLSVQEKLLTTKTTKWSVNTLNVHPWFICNHFSFAGSSWGSSQSQLALDEWRGTPSWHAETIYHSRNRATCPQIVGGAPGENPQNTGRTWKQTVLTTRPPSRSSAAFKIMGTDNTKYWIGCVGFSSSLSKSSTPICRTWGDHTTPLSSSLRWQAPQLTRGGGRERTGNISSVWHTPVLPSTADYACRARLCQWVVRGLNRWPLALESSK